MRWITLPLITLVVLAVLTLACEAAVSCSSSSSSSNRWVTKARGGAVIKKNAATAGAASSSSKLSKRTRGYKKEGFITRLVGGFKSFFGAFFTSLVNPTYEKDLPSGTSSSSSGGGVMSASAAIKANAAKRRRMGGKRVGSISDLPPEPSSCGG